MEDHFMIWMITYNGDYNANTVTQLTNKFHVSTTTYRYLDCIKYGTTDVCTESSICQKQLS